MSDIGYMDLNPPFRVSMTPGPSNAHPRVQRALLAPTVGHLDPYFLALMDDTMKLLRFVFETKNQLTFPICGSGSSGMEAGFCNFLEPGDTAVVGVSGHFGARMAEMASRYGANVVPVSAEPGRIIETEAIEAALKAQKKVKLLALVQAETSTGVLQPLTEAARLAKQYEALFLVDAVSSLGGQRLSVDDWGIDICYSGSQKCLSAFPGLAPITVNQASMDTIAQRTCKVSVWYLDLTLPCADFSLGRFYHYTAPVSLIYALHEALALVADEGLEARIERHLRHGAALQAGLEAMGLELFAEANHRASVVTAVRVPSDVNDAAIRKALLNENGIEIAGGLGPLKGQIWRIGLMGHSSSEQNILLLLNALEKLLSREGYSVAPAAGVKAAIEVLSKK